MQLSEADIHLLKREFEGISNWEEWGSFSNRHFDWDSAPELPLEKMEEDLRRESISKDGRLWEPFARNYDVPLEIEGLFEELQQKIFERLEPEAHAENLRHREQFGWQCLRCRVYTRPETQKCGFCGGILLPFPLNE